MQARHFAALILLGGAVAFVFYPREEGGSAAPVLVEAAPSESAVEEAAETEATETETEAALAETPESFSESDPKDSNPTPQASAEPSPPSAEVATDEAERAAPATTLPQPKRSALPEGYVPFVGSLERLGRRACAKNPQGWYIAGDAVEDYQIGFGTLAGESVAWIQAKVASPRPHAELNHCAILEPDGATTLRVTALVKGENVNDYANFHVRVTNESHQRLADKRRRFKNSFDWRPVELVVPVPEGAAYVVYGATFESSGKLWLKDVTFRFTESR